MPRSRDCCRSAFTKVVRRLGYDARALQGFLCQVTPSCLAWGSVFAAAIIVAGVAGCGPKGLPVAPVEGKVLYQGKPLEFGSVIFQPKAGPPARGTIRPDGTFRLTTYREGDGAILGSHQVRVVCNENMRPGFAPDPNQETPTGKPLIPAKYSAYDSPLKAEVKQKNEPFVFELTQ